MDYTQTSEEKVSMPGHYLLSSLHAGEWIERSPKYAHTPESIVKFANDARSYGNRVREISCSLMILDQELRSQLPEDSQAIIDLAGQLARGEINPKRIPQIFKLVK